MAADGSHGPRPWRQRQARTIFLRVPAYDWVKVSRGVKTEFRASPKACSALWDVETPTVVVAYRQHAALGYDARLMVLEQRWQEMLGAITPESLGREGFETLAQFRTYWVARERRRFPPTRIVTAYRLRPFEPEDREEMARQVFERLYGEWL